MITVVVAVRQFNKLMPVEKQCPDAESVSVEPSGALTLYDTVHTPIMGFNKDQWLSWQKGTDADHTPE